MRQPHACIVEDEAFVADALRLSLCDAGYRVCIAKNVGELITLLGAIRFDIVICDLQLGDGADGAALVEARRLAPNAALIATSGMTPERARAVAGQAGAHVFLPKPASSRTLFDAIKAALSRSRNEDGAPLQSGQRRPQAS